jgi:crotonyl-CoA carboxylase/reductase
MSRLELGRVPAETGWLPDTMQAVVIRKEREGDPVQAMQIEDVPLPTLGAREVLVLVMAAGVNYNGVWAARGAPVSVFRMHKEPFHIAGSDMSGIVWQVGSEVTRWKPGDHVVAHCNQSCGECPACNGLDPMACEQQKIWGYETSWGSFAQFAKVQSQQLVAKPPQMSWEDAASYGLTYFTAYRMLVTQANMQAGDNVLVWGAAGGLGIFAVQLCKLYGANPIAVVSSKEKEELVRSLGADMVINRREFDFSKITNGAEAEKLAEQRRFGKAIRDRTGGKDPDIVFEHVGRDTFSTSVFVTKKFGKVVICGATSGYELDFDVRYLWMRQKSILGSHFANAYEANRANDLILAGKIHPVVDDVFEFEQTAHDHLLMDDNKHMVKLVIRVQAPARGGAPK